jgi:flagellar basal body-associated protein FliL
LAEDDTGNKNRHEPLVLGVACFIVAAGISVTIFLFMNSDATNATRSQSQPDRVQVLEIEDPDEVLSGAVLYLEPFVINLKGESGVLYLQVSVEFYDFLVPQPQENIVPVLRDYIISKMSDRYERDLMVNGPEKTRELLLEDINARMPEENPITNVFVENFLIR